MKLIGTVVRLQVQRSRLKQGERPQRWYDPTPITAVPALEVGETGVVGLAPGGERVVDAHNSEHPNQHNVGWNGISLGFTSHYARMRSRFGPRLEDGIAGECIIVETDLEFLQDDLPVALTVEGQERLVHLAKTRTIGPCIEFSRYVLGYPGPPGPAPDPTVTEALQFLQHGMRGYCAAYEHGATVLRLGDRLYAGASRDGSTAAPSNRH